MKKYLFFVFLYLICYTTVNATSINNDIINQWIRIDGDKIETIEFLNDGTVIMVDKYHSTAGDFKFIDSNRLKINLGPQGIVVLKVALDKDGKLSVTEPSGKGSVFITRTMWVKKVNQSVDILFDKNSTLVWGKNGSISGKLQHKKAIQYINQLNTRKFGGYSDWRLPTKKDLETLFNYGEKWELSAQRMKALGFVDLQTKYWSSTHDDNGNYWNVRLHKKKGTVIISPLNKAASFYVLPVRNILGSDPDIADYSSQF